MEVFINMNFVKRLLTSILTAGIMISSVPLSGSAAGLTEIVNLKTNDMTCPIGVDDNIKFSWQMSSDVAGQKQTAYEVIVSESADLSNPVWTSGKIESDESIGIRYEGELKSSTRYYWQVKVWDKDNQVFASAEKAYFETGLLGDNAWDGSDWIKLGTSKTPQDIPDIINYTLEADITIVNTGVALLFESKDESNFLMWQLRNTDGKLIFKPHYRKNGNFTVLDEIDITSVMNGSLTSQQHMKIEVTDDVITTYINDKRVNQMDTSRLGGVGLTGEIGKIGFRADYLETENGWIDNIVLTDYAQDADGIVVKNYDFNDNVNPFTSGSVINGRFNALYTSGVENIGLEKHESEVCPQKYSVEADLTCSDTAVSVVFSAVDKNNIYMWQFNIAEQTGKVLLRPHTCIDGTFSTYAGNIKDVTSNVGGVDNFSKNSAHIKIDVTETQIKTYVNNTLVDTFNVGQKADNGSVAPAPVIGSIGTRTSLTETGTIDNLKLTDYLSNEDGEVIYEYSFDENNPFISGDISNGKYIAAGNLGVIIPLSGIDTFRKEFNVDKQVKSAKFYVTGLGVFDAYINGERIGTLQEDNTTTVYDELKPGYTHPEKHVFYLAYDITHLMNSGANTLSANVSAGWWGGMISGYYGSNSAFRAKLVLIYSDDSVETIGTDTTWKTSLQGPVLSADLYNGEIYDANADVSYRKNGYDDSEWFYAEKDKQFNGDIVSYIGEPVRVRDDLELSMNTATVYDGVVDVNDSQYGKINTVGVYNNGEPFTINQGEKAVIDLGQNFAGWGEVTVEGKKGTIITMRHGEMLNDNSGLKSRGNDGPQGSIYTANLRTAAAAAKYILSGNGEETYHSSHTFYGFRYMEISADHPVTIKNVNGIVVTSVQTDTGTIETGKDDVNKLISNIKWGQYSNYLSIPTDCPQRDERQGWTADTQVFSTAAAYNADSKAFLRKYMQDMRDSQKENGEFPDTAPYTGYGESGQLGWGDAGIVIPYNLYKMYGDVSVIEENYDAMKKFMDVFMASTNKNGGGHNHADWLTYEAVDSDVNTLYGIAYYAWDAQMLSEMAEVLGKTEDAEKYQRIYEQEKEYFISKYVRSDGSLRRTQQTACLMALKMDLLPDDASREKVKQQLLNNIKSKGNKLQTGFLGTAIIMQTLSDVGASDVAYTLLNQEDDPSWLYSVKQGATTIWERWNSYTIENGFGPVSMNSFNHYAYGAVAEWMYAYMAGIGYDFNNPGFKHINLAPTPDKSVGYVNCSYDSAYGTIVSNWKYEDDKFIYETTVPANTTATLTFPAAGVNMVTVNINGEDISLKEVNTGEKICEGVAYLGKQGSNRLFSLESGSYIVREGRDEPIHMTGIALNKNSAELNIGDKLTLTAQVIPEDTTDSYTIEWISSDNSVAKVQDGVVTALKEGKAVITAKAGNFEASCTVTVLPNKTITEPDPDSDKPDVKPSVIKVSSVKLTAKQKKIKVGRKTTVKAAVAPNNAADKKLVWKSSNSRIASVNQNGVVRGKKPGKVTITATANNGSAKGRIVITIQPPKVTGVKVSVKKRKAVVRFNRIKGADKYIVTVYKGKKKVRSVTLKSRSKKKLSTVVNKKLKKGKYSVRIICVQNKIKSDYTVKKFRVR